MNCIKAYTKCIFLLILILIPINLTYSKEWIFEISPNQLKLISSDMLESPKWFLKNYPIQNMVNLSFFDEQKAIGLYKDDFLEIQTTDKQWPIFFIDKDGAHIIRTIKLTDDQLRIILKKSKYLATGYPLLIEDGKKTKIESSYFTQRKCPRTALGLKENGNIIICITTSATISQLQDFFYFSQCKEAINFDGGGSTFLYVDKKKVYAPLLKRKYPNVLTWK